MSHSENERKNEAPRPESPIGNGEENLSEAPQAEGHPSGKVEESHPSHDHKKGHNKEHDLHKLEKQLAESSEKLAKMEDENALLKDSYVRKVAEFDNYKRRMVRDMDSIRQTANRELILELLPVFDNFGRALSAGEKSQDFKNLFEGLRITHSQISNILSHLDVKPIDAVGKPFDHNLHEALMMVESEDIEHDTTVVEELEKGYTLGELVLKHSKVKVARKKPK